MSSKKGFTLVELMVVILIVAILAAVAIPIMRGRIDAAKWSEGKAMMGTIATAIRAFCAETDTNIPDLSALRFDEDLGFRAGDLEGTYFSFIGGDFKILATGSQYIVQDNALTFRIQAEADPARSGINSPIGFTLDQSGLWTPLTTIM